MEIESDGALTFPAILREGVMIAAILSAWTVLALVGVGISNIGMEHSSPFARVGEQLVQFFLVVGVGNAVLYVLARGLQLSRE